MPGVWTTVDGNDACASVAYRLSDVIPISPMTPSSGLAEAADAWTAAQRPNCWGAVHGVPTFKQVPFKGSPAYTTNQTARRLAFYGELATRADHAGTC